MNGPFYLLPGHAARLELDGQQEGIDLLQAQREALETSPRTPDEAMALLCRKNYSTLEAAVSNAVTNTYDGPSAVARLIDEKATLADLLFLFGDKAKAALKKHVEALAESHAVKPISSADRRTKLRELDAELVERQEQEERAVLALRARGHRVLRRANLDPDVLLRVWNEPQASATSVAEDAAALLGVLDDDDDSDEAAA